MSQIWQTLSGKASKFWRDVRRYTSELSARTTKFTRDMIERVPWGHPALVDPMDGVNAAPLTGLHAQHPQQGQAPAQQVPLAQQSADETAEDARLAA